MAQRTKTVEYAFPLSTTNLASAVARDFTTFTLSIPENTSRTFRSVILEMSFEDNGAAAASITAILIGVQIDAVARNDATVTQTLTNSGETQSYTVTRDVTSYFQTNFTSTSHTLGARLTVTAQTTINASAKLIVTYEYSDTSATTRIKTVKIPVDGNVTTLTNALSNVGGVGQIPALDTFLPEASKTYRDIFFEVFTHTGQLAGTTNASLILSYNSGTTTVFTTHNGALNSDYTIHRIDKLITAGVPSFATSSTQNLQAASTGNANILFPCVSGILVVTYEYNHSATTTVINSLEIPIFTEPCFAGGTAIGDTSEFAKSIMIQEPTTITLVQSAVLLTATDGGLITFDIRVGAQTSRTYVHPATTRGGAVFFMRRFDSGAAGGGAGYTYNRGFNTLELSYFSTSATLGNIGSAVSGVAYLNYTSGLNSSGDGVHSHTTKWVNRPYLTAGLAQKVTYTQTTATNIAETNYYTVDIGFQSNLYVSGVSVVSSYVLLAELLSTESPGAGWYTMSSLNAIADAEASALWVWTPASNSFKRTAQDPDTTRLDIESIRSYRSDNPTANIAQMTTQYLTYHSILYSISATIQNSSGGTVTLNLHRSDNGELVRTTSRTGDGSVSIDWYDNSIKVYIVAIDVDLSTAIYSDVFVAGAVNPTLNFAGGATYYAYAG